MQCVCKPANIHLLLLSQPKWWNAFHYDRIWSLSVSSTQINTNLLFSIPVLTYMPFSIMIVSLLLNKIAALLYIAEQSSNTLLVIFKVSQFWNFLQFASITPPSPLLLLDRTHLLKRQISSKGGILQKQRN